MKLRVVRFSATNMMKSYVLYGKSSEKYNVGACRIICVVNNVNSLIIQSAAIKLQKKNMFE